MTTIEIDEQMLLLKEQKKEQQKLLKKMKKDYDTYLTLKRNNKIFDIIYSRCRISPASFERLVRHYKWKNTDFTPIEWNFIYDTLRLSDSEFFTAFMSWNDDIFKLEFDDRKCPCCLAWYSKSVMPRKFKNCEHFCCENCYSKIGPMKIRLTNFRVALSKCCVICRKNEMPEQRAIIYESDESV
jgi:hypothetical protein